MSDGTTKPIEMVLVGDWVWAADPLTGEEGPRQVLNTIMGQGQKELIQISVKEKACGCGPVKGTLTATHDHPFWVASENAWVLAENLKRGDALLAESGETVYVSFVQAQTVPFETVFNLTIDGLHTYYVLVGKEPVLVHNCGFSRVRPRLETGNLNEGWTHIEARHIRGNHPDGAGDLFAPGTTRGQVLQTAEELVDRGVRISDPTRRIQTYERHLTVNGMHARYRVVVDSADGNRIITCFPVLGGG